MKLQMVEIYGFKSFAQRTELSFDKGITGIVGPNGSGKSNIADAVRWVLGEQSAKMLRGTRMEDVIFGGTQSRKALPYCEVSLLFENEDQALNSQYAEVLVTRRVYRSGEGEYYLNKKSCRLRDVLELFRDTGIGKEGYSIIGQGRVEEILSTKGEERRAVFEEAAGIVTFRVRKEEAQRKLARTGENLTRLTDILDELESRLAGLKSQSSSAQTFLGLSEELRNLELNAFLVRHDRLSERINTLKQFMDSLSDTITGQESFLQSLSQSRITLEEEIEAIDLRDRSARAAVLKAQEGVAALSADVQREQQKQVVATDTLVRLKKQAAASSMREAELREMLALSRVDRHSQEERLTMAQALMANEEQALVALLADADAQEEKLNAHKQRFVDSLSHLSDVRASQARQQAMLQQMQRRREELQTQAAQARDAQTESVARLETVSSDLQRVTDALAEIICEEARLQTSLDTVQAKTSAFQEQAQSLANNLHASKNRLSLLQEMARDYEGYGQAVKRALQRAENNPKVFGVIADIIRVPQQYETALEMILGGTLQHIVTQDEETAKDLIDYLRANRLGRTTFLPISAVRSRTLSSEEKGKLGGSGCFGIASDLITFDSRFRGVVENVLGRTVIVRDMDTAISLSRSARQTFNVVTLAGDVMRAGGAMTGGTSQGRSTSLLGRQREMEEVALRIEEEQAKLSEIMASYISAKSRAEEISRLHREVQDALGQENIAQAREQERVQNAIKDSQAARDRLSALDEAAVQLQSGIDEITRDLEQSSRQTTHSTMDQAAMEQETALMQQALVQIRLQAEAQRTRLSQAVGERTALTHQNEILSRDTGRWQAELEGLTRRLVQYGEEVKALECTLMQSQQEEKRLRESLEAAVLASEGSKAALEAVLKERSERQGAQKDLTRRTEAAHEQLAVDRDKLHRNELTLTRAQGELQTLGDHILNTYDLTYAGAAEHRLEGKFDLSRADNDIKSIKADIRALGMVNVAAIQEYAAAQERFNTMSEQRLDALKAQQDLQQLIDQLLRKMEKQFVSEFEKLNHFFSETFARLFGGGQANLVLTDPSNPLTCDIDVAAQPPGKNLQLLSLLSGGERSLTAIAILFAMLKLKPTPFCILDEIEAALDEANIGYFADYLSEYARSTQFVVITHRKGTMERCDALYGVAMEEKGVSSMVSVDLQQFA